MDSTTNVTKQQQSLETTATNQSQDLKAAVGDTVRRNKRRKPPNYYQSAEYAAILKNSDTIPVNAAASTSTPSPTCQANQPNNDSKTINEFLADLSINKTTSNLVSSSSSANFDNPQAELTTVPVSTVNDETQQESQQQSLAKAAWNKPLTTQKTAPTLQEPPESNNATDNTDQQKPQVDSVSPPSHPQSTPSTTASDNLQPAPAPKQAPVSWATLFKSSNTSTTAEINSSQPHRKPSQPANPAVETNGHTEATTTDSEVSTPVEVLMAMGNIFKQCELKHSAPALQPRGIRNKQSWCYINATLQALLACPPFYNLIKSIFQ